MDLGFLSWVVDLGFIGVLGSGSLENSEVRGLRCMRELSRVPPNPTTTQP